MRGNKRGAGAHFKILAERREFLTKKLAECKAQERPHSYLIGEIQALEYCLTELYNFNLHRPEFAESIKRKCEERGFNPIKLFKE